MTQPNTQTTIDSAHAVRENNNTESKDSDSTLDVRDARQPIQETRSFLDNYCAANPGAAQCRVYDV
jgi:hypothetical protein